MKDRFPPAKSRGVRAGVFPWHGNLPRTRPIGPLRAQGLNLAFMVCSASARALGYQTLLKYEVLYTTKSLQSSDRAALLT